MWNKRIAAIVVLSGILTLLLTIINWYLFTKPCERFLYWHKNELDDYSSMLISQNNDKANSGDNKAGLPGFARNSGINHIEVREGMVVYSFYRWYTFPDGAMDNLVYFPKYLSIDAIINSDSVRKPVDSAKSIDKNWAYIETE